MQFEDSSFEVQGIRLPLEDWDVILGRPWLQSVNPTVDWQTGEVRCRRTGQLLIRLKNSRVRPSVSLVTAQEAAREMKKKGTTLFIAKICKTQAEDTKTDFGVKGDVKLKKLLSEL